MNEVIVKELGCTEAEASALFDKAISYRIVPWLVKKPVVVTNEEIAEYEMEEGEDEV